VTFQEKRLSFALLVFAFIITAFVLGGCAGSRPASVNGECRIFDDPGFAVQGKRLKDKQWIGSTQEKGIEVCKWKRPTE
jgi:hypothetical protein